MEMAIFDAYSAKNPRKVREKEKRDRGEREKRENGGDYSKTQIAETPMFSKFS